ncbi:hypothetical protein [Methanoculleus sp.]|uniref:hypothetical protein n=1 Tax=Methanoculleus sp. TaxID=90427 RepID=UPI0025ED99CA|nr:hypothetical protein [Methanoculleus sp.]MCK9317166.1 hypothetical protein [Methanoculleus sp.]
MKSASKSSTETSAAAGVARDEEGNERDAGRIDSLLRIAEPGVEERYYAEDSDDDGPAFPLREAEVER